MLVEHGASVKLTNKDGDNAYRAAVAMGEQSNRPISSVEGPPLIEL
jgi:hypothetical protein